MGLREGGENATYQEKPEKIDNTEALTIVSSSPKTSHSQLDSPQRLSKIVASSKLPPRPGPGISPGQKREWPIKIPVWRFLTHFPHPKVEKQPKGQHPKIQLRGTWCTLPCEKKEHQIAIFVSGKEKEGMNPFKTNLSFKNILLSRFRAMKIERFKQYFAYQIQHVIAPNKKFKAAPLAIRQSRRLIFVPIPWLQKKLGHFIRGQTCISWSLTF